MKLSSILACLAMMLSVARADEASLAGQATQSLRRGVGFFRHKVAVHGTYLWQYSADLSKREGESKASSTEGWFQPPGTPAVGAALLNAYEATGDSFYIEAARETADGLIRGQLRSGGWSYYIDFAEKPSRRALAYRNSKENAKARNVTTLDDDVTQSALRFLALMDQALKFQDANIHESIEYALNALFHAQYPNGAWPQGYDQFPDPDAFPVKQASYPESWERVWPGSQDYWLRYTLNDNVLANMIETMFLAERVYTDPSAGERFTQLAARCRESSERAGGFILLAQMPDPQPAWAQQYDFEMHPAWARKFEPPAITGGESQGMLRTLLMLYRETGHRKYLGPIPRALEYLQQSRLPDGRLARFYELRTNKPLYFTRDYQLTYDDSAMPTHYAFKGGDSTAAIARSYERIKNLPANQLKSSDSEPRSLAGDALAAEVRSIIGAQDERGRWIEEASLRYYGPDDTTKEVIRCSTFIRNVDTLSRYLAQARRER